MTLLGLVGDVLVNRAQPGEAFSAVREVLAAPELLFGNLECVYTDHPLPVPGTSFAASAPAHNLQGIIDAGFSVLSLANNHVLDAGYAAMLDTRARLKAAGVATCGAGDNLADARAPAIIEADGISVAFLAYASVFPAGYEARSDMPGLAPMRGYDSWRAPHPRVHLPGTLPITITTPDPIDLARLEEDIDGAKQRAALVVTSFHWGDHTRPYHLTDHERRIAHHAIDRGADLVVGHHHHALRGIEWYRGKPIFYGLGHFVFDLPVEFDQASFRSRQAEFAPHWAETPYSLGPREGWPLLPMHEDTRMTALAWARIDGAAITAIGLLPCRLTPDGCVHPLRAGADDHAAVCAYLAECNRSQGLAGTLVAGGPALAGYPTLRFVAADAKGAE